MSSWVGLGRHRVEWAQHTHGYRAGDIDTERETYTYAEWRRYRHIYMREGMIHRDAGRKKRVERERHAETVAE